MLQCVTFKLDTVVFIVNFHPNLKTNCCFLSTSNYILELLKKICLRFSLALGGNSKIIFAQNSTKIISQRLSIRVWKGRERISFFSYSPASRLIWESHPGSFSSLCFSPTIKGKCQTIICTTPYIMLTQDNYLKCFKECLRGNISRIIPCISVWVCIKYSSLTKSFPMNHAAICFSQHTWVSFMSFFLPFLCTTNASPWRKILPLQSLRTNRVWISPPLPSQG